MPQVKISQDGTCNMLPKAVEQKMKCPSNQICVAVGEITDLPGICALRERECSTDGDCPQTGNGSYYKENVRPAGDGAVCKETRTCGLCVLR
jgi:hypothetical protein